jgi:7-cyano-7-deazaguanine reductase
MKAPARSMSQAFQPPIPPPLPTEPSLALLDTWPNAAQGSDYLIHIEVPEFTSVCPKTGLPDFGTITIDYIPADVCLELKAFKYYMLAYRQFGMFYESITNRIADDIMEVAQPRWLRVRSDFMPRGGISTQAVVVRCQPGYNLPNALVQGLELP